jgi:hypothetical protein
MRYKFAISCYELLCKATKLSRFPSNTVYFCHRRPLSAFAVAARYGYNTLHLFMLCDKCPSSVTHRNDNGSEPKCIPSANLKSMAVLLKAGHCVDSINFGGESWIPEDSAVQFSSPTCPISRMVQLQHTESDRDSAANVIRRDTPTI